MRIVSLYNLTSARWHRRRFANYQRILHNEIIQFRFSPSSKKSLFVSFCKKNHYLWHSLVIGPCKFHLIPELLLKYLIMKKCCQKVHLYTLNYTFPNHFCIFVHFVLCTGVRKSKV